MLIVSMGIRNPFGAVAGTAVSPGTGANTFTVKAKLFTAGGTVNRHVFALDVASDATIWSYVKYGWCAPVKSSKPSGLRTRTTDSGGPTVKPLLNVGSATSPLPRYAVTRGPPWKKALNPSTVVPSRVPIGPGER